MRNRCRSLPHSSIQRSFIRLQCCESNTAPACATLTQRGEFHTIGVRILQIMALARYSANAAPTQPRRNAPH
jgi:hypothetical protein